MHARGRLNRKEGEAINRRLHNGRIQGTYNLERSFAALTQPALRKKALERDIGENTHNCRYTATQTGH